MFRRAATEEKYIRLEEIESNVEKITNNLKKGFDLISASCRHRRFRGKSRKRVIIRI